MNRIRLMKIHINEKERIMDWMNELFSFDHTVRNLDDLADCLSEVQDETMFVLSEDDLDGITTFGIRFLNMLVDAVKQNPHLHMHMQ